MTLALTGLGAFILVGWAGYCSNRYFQARRISQGLDPRPGLDELLSGVVDEHLAASMRREREATLESLRRRVWLSFALLLGYMLFGIRFWAMVVGWLHW